MKLRLVRMHVIKFNALLISISGFTLLVHTKRKDAAEYGNENVDFHRHRRLPHFMIIGEMKCGTTALQLMLSDIYPNVKIPYEEAHFFSNDEQYHLGGLNYYKYVLLPEMTHPKDIIGEKTPGYFRIEKCLDRISKDTPRSKFILLLCDPVKRTVSDFLHGVNTGWHKDLPKGYPYSIAQFLTFGNGSYNTNHTMVQTSLYGKSMSSWLKKFPKEQILVLNGQDLVSDSASLTSLFEKVETFLGLPNQVTNVTFFKGDSNFYCWMIRNHSRCLQELLYKRTSREKGRIHPKTEGEIKKLVDFLKDYYTPWNNLLFDQIGESFHWKMNEA